MKSSWFLDTGLDILTTPYLKTSFEKFLEKGNIDISNFKIRDTQIFYRELAKGICTNGGLTARLGELYVSSQWKYDGELDDFFCTITSSKTAMQSLDVNAITQILDYWKRLHPRNPQTVGKAHYDIPVQMYERMLGKTMKYTAPEWNENLGEFCLDTSQKLAMEMICQRSELENSGETPMKVLELGFGYGTLADHAIRNYQVHVTGLTVSEGQKKFAEQYMSHNGTLKNAHLKNLDWKKLFLEPKYQNIFEEQFKGKFDRIISIEMIEAVSTKDLPDFFKFLAACLHDDGILFIQAINSDRLVYTTDGFIDRYIFPDGVVPEENHILCCAEKGGFRQEIHARDIATQAYDKALMLWYKNLRDSYPEISSELDFYYNSRDVDSFPYRDSPSFLKIFEYYLKSCAGSFRSQYNRDGQYKFYKNPHSSTKDIIPATLEQMRNILKTKEWGESPIKN